MKAMLIDAGWFMFHSCSCGGSYKEKYKHPSKPAKQIHIRPSKDKWFYLQSNRVYAEGNTSTLQAKLNEI